MVPARGEDRAEYALGALLLSGHAHSASEDERREAANAIEAAAIQGLPDAEAEMSYVYAEGIGRTRNYCAAKEWAQKGAQKGVAVALYNLGVAYHNGNCLSQDDLIAVTYYRRALTAQYLAPKAS
jgi:uncharacterized protein